jgi:hypothetical protein
MSRSAVTVRPRTVLAQRGCANGAVIDGTDIAFESLD